jgi:hypothetical protein
MSEYDKDYYGGSTLDANHTLDLMHVRHFVRPRSVNCSNWSQVLIRLLSYPFG